MTEATPEIEYTEQDVADLAALGVVSDGKAPEFHPILEVWREVLKPAESQLDADVTPQWAARIVGTHQGMQFSDMLEYRERYFGKIVELCSILDAEIATDDDCLTYRKPEEDVEENSQHYRNLLRDWQLEFVRWEMAWDCADPYAAVELAAISEVHKMFFSQEGITAFLDNIGFEYTEADQAELAAALDELRGER